MDLKKIGLFAGGVLFGTAGIKALSSKDAKKAYTQTTAAALRVKDSVMNTVTAVRENADDIYAGAQAKNAALSLKMLRRKRKKRQRKPALPQRSLVKKRKNAPKKRREARRSNS